MRQGIMIAGEQKNMEDYRQIFEQMGICMVDCRTCDHCCLWDYQGLVIAGEGDLTGEEQNMEEQDHLEWKLLGDYIEQDKPVLGICKGMQMINQYLGGTMNIHAPLTGLHRGRHCNSRFLENVESQALDRSDSRVLKTVDPRHMTIAIKESFMEKLYGIRFPVNSDHQYGIDRLGHGLEAVQFAEDRVVEGIRHESLPIYGVQWHPERMEHGDRLFKFWSRLFPNIV